MINNKSLQVNIGVNASEATAGLRKVAGSVKNFGRQVEKTSSHMARGGSQSFGNLKDAGLSSAEAVQAGWKKSLTNIKEMTISLLASKVIGGITSQVREFQKDVGELSLQYEKTLMGVRKTAGMTTGDIEDLGKQLRQISTNDLPIAANELGNVADVAAHMGINTVKGLTGFAESVSKAALALPEFAQGASEIADVVGQQLNIYGITTKFAKDKEMWTKSAYEYLSIMDKLSNNAATDAKKISEFISTFTEARRLGFQYHEVAAIGAAFTSMGKAGNTAATQFQTALLNLSTTGLPKVRQLLELTGTSMEEWKATFKMDKMKGLRMITDQLQQLGEFEQSKYLNAIFGKIGLKSVGSLMANWKLVDTMMQHSGEEAAVLRGEIEGTAQIEKEMLIVQESAAFHIDKMKNAWNSLKIVVGQGVLPEVADFAEMITPAINVLTDFLDSTTIFKRLQEGMNAINEGFSSLVSGAKNALTDLGLISEESGRFVAKVEDVLGRVIVHFYTLSNYLQGIGKRISLSAGALREAGWVEAVENIKTVVYEVFSLVGKLIPSGKGLESVFSKFVDIVGKGFLGIPVVLNSILPIVTKLLGMVPSIVSATSTGLSRLVGVGKIAIDIFATGLASTFSGFSYIGDVIDRVRSSVLKLYKRGKELVTGLSPSMINISGIFQEFYKVVYKVGKYVGSILTNAVNYVSKSFSNLQASSSSVMSSLSSIGDIINNKVSVAYGYLKSKVIELIQPLRDLWGEMDVSSMFSRVSDKVRASLDRMYLSISTIPTKLSGLQLSLGNMFRTIVSMFKFYSNVVKKVASDFKLGFLSGLGPEGLSIVNAFYEILSAVFGKIRTVVLSVRDAVFDFFAAVRYGEPSLKAFEMGYKMGDLLRKVLIVVTRSIDYLAKGLWVFSEYMKIAYRHVSVFGGALGKVSEVISSLYKSVSNFIRSGGLSDMMYNAFSATMSAVDGLRSYVNIVKQAASRFSLGFLVGFGPKGIDLIESFYGVLSSIFARIVSVVGKARDLFSEFFNVTQGGNKWSALTVGYNLGKMLYGVADKIVESYTLVRSTISSAIISVLDLRDSANSMLTSVVSKLKSFIDTVIQAVNRFRLGFITGLGPEGISIINSFYLSLVRAFTKIKEVLVLARNTFLEFLDSLSVNESSWTALSIGYKLGKLLHKSLVSIVSVLQLGQQGFGKLAEYIKPTYKYAPALSDALYKSADAVAALYKSTVEFVKSGGLSDALEKTVSAIRHSINAISNLIKYVQIASSEFAEGFKAGMDPEAVRILLSALDSLKRLFSNILSITRPLFTNILGIALSDSANNLSKMNQSARVFYEIGHVTAQVFSGIVRTIDLAAKELPRFWKAAEPLRAVIEDTLYRSFIRVRDLLRNFAKDPGSVFNKLATMVRGVAVALGFVSTRIMSLIDWILELGNVSYVHSVLPQMINFLHAILTPVSMIISSIRVWIAVMRDIVPVGQAVTYTLGAAVQAILSPISVMYRSLILVGATLKDLVMNFVTAGSEITNAWRMVSQFEDIGAVQGVIATVGASVRALLWPIKIVIDAFKAVWAVIRDIGELAFGHSVFPEMRKHIEWVRDSVLKLGNLLGNVIKLPFALIEAMSRVGKTSVSIGGVSIVESDLDTSYIDLYIDYIEKRNSELGELLESIVSKWRSVVDTLSSGLSSVLGGIRKSFEGFVGGIRNFSKKAVAHVEELAYDVIWEYIKFTESLSKVVNRARFILNTFVRLFDLDKAVSNLWGGEGSLLGRIGDVFNGITNIIDSGSTDIQVMIAYKLSKIKGPIDDIIEQFEPLTDAFDRIIEGVKGRISNLLSAISMIGSGKTSTLSKLGGIVGIDTPLEDALEKMTAFEKAVAYTFGNVIKFLNKIGVTFSAVSRGISTAVDFVVEVFSNFYEAIVATIDLIKYLGDVAYGHSVFPEMKDHIGDLMEPIGAVIGAIRAMVHVLRGELEPSVGIIDALNYLFDAADAPISAFISGIRLVAAVIVDLVGTIKGDLTDSFAAMASFFKGQLSLKGALSSIMKSAVNSVLWPVRVFKDAYRAFREVAENIWNDIRYIVRSIGAGVGMVKDALWDWAGGFLPSTDWYAPIMKIFHDIGTAFMHIEDTWSWDLPSIDEMGKSMEQAFANTLGKAFHNIKKELGWMKKRIELTYYDTFTSLDAGYKSITGNISSTFSSVVESIRNATVGRIQSLSKDIVNEIKRLKGRYANELAGFDKVSQGLTTVIAALWEEYFAADVKALIENIKHIYVSTFKGAIDAFFDDSEAKAAGYRYVNSLSLGIKAKNPFKSLQLNMISFLAEAENITFKDFWDKEFKYAEGGIYKWREQYTGAFKKFAEDLSQGDILGAFKFFLRLSTITFDAIPLLAGDAVRLVVQQFMSLGGGKVGERMKQLVGTFGKVFQDITRYVNAFADEMNRRGREVVEIFSQPINIFQKLYRAIETVVGKTTLLIARQLLFIRNLVIAWALFQKGSMLPAIALFTIASGLLRTVLEDPGKFIDRPWVALSQWLSNLTGQVKETINIFDDYAEALGMIFFIALSPTGKANEIRNRFEQFHDAVVSFINELLTTIQNFFSNFSQETSGSMTIWEMWGFGLARALNIATTVVGGLESVFKNVVTSLKGAVAWLYKNKNVFKPLYDNMVMVLDFWTGDQGVGLLFDGLNGLVRVISNTALKGSNAFLGLLKVLNASNLFSTILSGLEHVRTVITDIGRYGPILAAPFREASVSIKEYRGEMDRIANIMHLTYSTVDASTGKQKETTVAILSEYQKTAVILGNIARVIKSINILGGTGLGIVENYTAMLRKGPVGELGRVYRWIKNINDLSKEAWIAQGAHEYGLEVNKIRMVIDSLSKSMRKSDLGRLISDELFRPFKEVYVIGELADDLRPIVDDTGRWIGEQLITSVGDSIRVGRVTFLDAVLSAGTEGASNLLYAFRYALGNKIKNFFAPLGKAFGYETMRVFRVNPRDLERFIKSDFLAGMDDLLADDLTEMLARGASRADIETVFEALGGVGKVESELVKVGGRFTEVLQTQKVAFRDMYPTISRLSSAIGDFVAQIRAGLGRLDVSGYNVIFDSLRLVEDAYGNLMLKMLVSGNKFARAFAITVSLPLIGFQAVYDKLFTTMSKIIGWWKTPKAPGIFAKLYDYIKNMTAVYHIILRIVASLVVSTFTNIYKRTAGVFTWLTGKIASNYSLIKGLTKDLGKFIGRTLNKALVIEQYLIAKPIIGLVSTTVKAAKLIVNNLLPVRMLFDDLKSIFAPLSAGAQSSVAAARGVSKYLSKLPTIMINVLSVFDKWSYVFQDFKNAFVVLMDTIKNPESIAEGVSAIIGHLTTAMVRLKTFAVREILEMVQGILTAARAALSYLGGNLQVDTVIKALDKVLLAVQWVSQRFQSTMGSIAPFVQKMLSDTWAVISGTTERFNGLYGQFVGLIGSVVRMLSKYIGNAVLQLADFVEYISEAFSKARSGGDMIVAGVKVALEGIKRLFTFTINNLRSMMPEIGLYLKKALHLDYNPFESLPSFARLSLDSVIKIAKGAASLLVKVLGEVWKAFKPMLKRYLPDVADIGLFVVFPWVQAFAGLVKLVGYGLKKLTGKYDNWAINIVKVIADLMMKLGDAFMHPVRTATDYIHGAIDRLLGRSREFDEKAWVPNMQVGLGIDAKELENLALAENMVSKIVAKENERSGILVEEREARVKLAALEAEALRELVKSTADLGKLEESYKSVENLNTQLVGTTKVLGVARNRLSGFTGDLAETPAVFAGIVSESAKMDTNLRDAEKTVRFYHEAIADLGDTAIYHSVFPDMVNWLGKVNSSTSAVTLSTDHASRSVGSIAREGEAGGKIILSVLDLISKYTDKISFAVSKSIGYVKEYKTVWGFVISKISGLIGMMRSFGSTSSQLVGGLMKGITSPFKALGKGDAGAVDKISKKLFSRRMLLWKRQAKNYDDYVRQIAEVIRKAEQTGGEDVANALASRLSKFVPKKQLGKVVEDVAAAVEKATSTRAKSMKEAIESGADIKLPGMFKRLKMSLRESSEGFSQAKKAINKLWEPIGKLTAKIRGLVSNWGIWQKFMSRFARSGDETVGILARIGKYLSKVKGFGIGMLSKGFGKLGSTLKLTGKLFSKIAVWVAPLSELIKGIAGGDFVEGLSKMVPELYVFIPVYGQIAALIEGIAFLLKDGTAILDNYLSKWAGNPIVDSLRDVLQLVGQIADIVITVFKGLKDVIYNVVKGIIGSVVKMFKGDFDGALVVITDSAKATVKVVVTMIKAIFGKIKTMFVSWFSWKKLLRMGDLFYQILNPFSLVIKAMYGLFEAAIKKMLGPDSKTYKLIKWIGDNVISLITDPLKSAYAIFKKVYDTITGKAGVGYVERSTGDIDKANAAIGAQINMVNSMIKAEKSKANVNKAALEQLLKERQILTKRAKIVNQDKKEARKYLAEAYDREKKSALGMDVNAPKKAPMMRVVTGNVPESGLGKIQSMFGKALATSKTAEAAEIQDAMERRAEIVASMDEESSKKIVAAMDRQIEGIKKKHEKHREKLAEAYKEDTAKYKTEEEKRADEHSAVTKSLSDKYLSAYKRSSEDLIFKIEDVVEKTAKKREGFLGKMLGFGKKKINVPTRTPNLDQATETIAAVLETDLKGLIGEQKTIFGNAMDEAKDVGNMARNTVVSSLISNVFNPDAMKIAEQKTKERVEALGDFLSKSPKIAFKATDEVERALERLDRIKSKEQDLSIVGQFIGTEKDLKNLSKVDTSIVSIFGQAVERDTEAAEALRKTLTTLINPKALDKAIVPALESGGVRITAQLQALTGKTVDQAKGFRGLVEEAIRVNPMVVLEMLRTTGAAMSKNMENVDSAFVKNLNGIKKASGDAMTSFKESVTETGYIASSIGKFQEELMKKSAWYAPAEGTGSFIDVNKGKEVEAFLNTFKEANKIVRTTDNYVMALSTSFIQQGENAKKSADTMNNAYQHLLSKGLPKAHEFMKSMTTVVDDAKQKGLITEEQAQERMASLGTMRSKLLGIAKSVNKDIDPSSFEEIFNTALKAENGVARVMGLMSNEMQAVSSYTDAEGKAISSLYNKMWDTGGLYDEMFGKFGRRSQGFIKSLSLVGTHWDDIKEKAKEADKAQSEYRAHFKDDVEFNSRVERKMAEDLKPTVKIDFSVQGFDAAIKKLSKAKESSEGTTKAVRKAFTGILESSSKSMQSLMKNADVIYNMDDAALKSYAEAFVKHNANVSMSTDTLYSKMRELRNTMKSSFDLTAYEVLTSSIKDLVATTDEAGKNIVKLSTENADAMAGVFVNAFRENLSPEDMGSILSQMEKVGGASVDKVVALIREGMQKTGPELGAWRLAISQSSDVAGLLEESGLSMQNFMKLLDSGIVASKERLLTVLDSVTSKSLKLRKNVTKKARDDNAAMIKNIVDSSQKISSYYEKGSAESTKYWDAIIERSGGSLKFLLAGVRQHVNAAGQMHDKHAEMLAKSFSVSVEQVKSLAQEYADSVKNTAQLTVGTLSKANDELRKVFSSGGNVGAQIGRDFANSSDEIKRAMTSLRTAIGDEGKINSEAVQRIAEATGTSFSEMMERATIIVESGLYKQTDFIKGISTTQITETQRVLDETLGATVSYSDSTVKVLTDTVNQITSSVGAGTAASANAIDKIVEMSDSKTKKMIEKARKLVDQKNFDLEKSSELMAQLFGKDKNVMAEFLKSIAEAANGATDALNKTADAANIIVASEVKDLFEEGWLGATPEGRQVEFKARGGKVGRGERRGTPVPTIVNEKGPEGFAYGGSVYHLPGGKHGAWLPAGGSVIPANKYQQGGVISALRNFANTLPDPDGALNDLFQGLQSYDTEDKRANFLKNLGKTYGILANQAISNPSGENKELSEKYYKQLSNAITKLPNEWHVGMTKEGVLKADTSGMGSMVRVPDDRMMSYTKAIHQHPRSLATTPSLRADVPGLADLYQMGNYMEAEVADIRGYIHKITPTDLSAFNSANISKYPAEPYYDNWYIGEVSDYPSKEAYEKRKFRMMEDELSGSEDFRKKIQERTAVQNRSFRIAEEVLRKTGDKAEAMQAYDSAMMHEVGKVSGFKYSRIEGLEGRDITDADRKKSAEEFDKLKSSLANTNKALGIEKKPEPLSIWDKIVRSTGIDKFQSGGAIQYAPAMFNERGPEAITYGGTTTMLHGSKVPGGEVGMLPVGGYVHTAQKTRGMLKRGEVGRYAGGGNINQPTNIESKEMGRNALWQTLPEFIEVDNFVEILQEIFNKTRGHKGRSLRKLNERYRYVKEGFSFIEWPEEERKKLLGEAVTIAMKHRLVNRNPYVTMGITPKTNVPNVRPGILDKNWDRFLFGGFVQNFQGGGSVESIREKIKKAQERKSKIQASNSRYSDKQKEYIVKQVNLDIKNLEEQLSKTVATESKAKKALPKVRQAEKSIKKAAYSKWRDDKGNVHYGNFEGDLNKSKSASVTKGKPVNTASPSVAAAKRFEKRQAETDSKKVGRQSLWQILPSSINVDSFIETAKSIFNRTRGHRGKTTRGLIKTFGEIKDGFSFVKWEEAKEVIPEALSIMMKNGLIGRNPFIATGMAQKTTGTSGTHGNFWEDYTSSIDKKYLFGGVISKYAAGGEIKSADKRKLIGPTNGVTANELPENQYTYKGKIYEVEASSNVPGDQKKQIAYQNTLKKQKWDEDKAKNREESKAKTEAATESKARNEQAAKQYIESLRITKEQAKQQIQSPEDALTLIDSLREKLSSKKLPITEKAGLPKMAAGGKVGLHTKSGVIKKSISNVHSAAEEKFGRSWKQYAKMKQQEAKKKIKDEQEETKKRISEYVSSGGTSGIGGGKGSNKKKTVAGYMEEILNAWRGGIVRSYKYGGKVSEDMLTSYGTMGSSGKSEGESYSTIGGKGISSGKRGYGSQDKAQTVIDQKIAEVKKTSAEKKLKDLLDKTLSKLSSPINERGIKSNKILAWGFRNNMIPAEKLAVNLGGTGPETKVKGSGKPVKGGSRLGAKPGTTPDAKKLMNGLQKQEQQAINKEKTRMGIPQIPKSDVGVGKSAQDKMKEVTDKYLTKLVGRPGRSLNGNLEHLNNLLHINSNGWRSLTQEKKFALIESAYGKRIKKNKGDETLSKEFSGYMGRLGLKSFGAGIERDVSLVASKLKLNTGSSKGLWRLPFKEQVEKVREEMKKYVGDTPSQMLFNRYGELYKVYKGPGTKAERAKRKRELMKVYSKMKSIYGRKEAYYWAKKAQGETTKYGDPFAPKNKRIGGGSRVYANSGLAMSKGGVVPTLVGERGFELLFRGNKTALVGSTGPEVQSLRKGDYVLPHKLSDAMLNYDKGGSIGLSRKLRGEYSNMLAMADGGFIGRPKFAAGGSVNGGMNGDINTSINISVDGANVNDEQALASKLKPLIEDAIVGAIQDNLSI
ncbi:MAG: phage tail tape measure protein [bacterium]|nr:phage tail tape measure protein [bacterium]